MTTRLLHRFATGSLSAILAFGAACGDDDESPQGSRSQQATSTVVPVLTAPTSPTQQAKITIQSFAFSGIEGAAANIPFTVENKDSVPHTVTSVDGKFPVWAVAPGESKTFGSLVPGSYPIRCDVHPSRMTGNLVVK